MPWYIECLIFYISAINLIGIILTVYDKIAAIRSFHRISERTLLWLAVFGASVTMYFTMKLIRHKTQHRKFMVGIPLIMLFQLLLVTGIFVVKSYV